MEHVHGLILAGGRGTRFWPKSRRSHRQAGPAAVRRPLPDPADRRPAAAGPAARAHLDPDQRPSARRDRSPASGGPQAPDSGGACAAQHGAGNRSGRADSPRDRSGIDHGRVSGRPRDRQAAPVCPPAQGRAESRARGKDRGAGDPAALARDRLRLYRVSQRREAGRSEAAAGQAFPREARCDAPRHAF